MSNLRKKIDALRGGDFFRAVGILVGGTVIAQVITVIALPIVTRLYSPDDFSVLAVYTSILSIFVAVACLRFEIAIPMPDDETEAVNLLALALFCCTIFSALFALLLSIWTEEIVTLIDQRKLKPYLMLLPIGLWLASAFAAIQYWVSRKKRFSTIARTRMVQSLCVVGVQLGMGILHGIGALGLLLGQVVSSCMGMIGLCRSIKNTDQPYLRKISWSGMRSALKRYQRFPKYSTFEAFANSAAIDIPVILIAAKSIGPDAGYLMLATRAMSIPMGMIGGAVSQVYLSKASDEMRSGNLGVFTTRIVGGLMKSGVGPLIFIGIVSPVGFPLIFGSAWHEAGYMVAWMTPWFVMQFLSSPVSMTLHVAGRQEVALLLQFVGLVIRVGSVGGAIVLEINSLVEIYAVSGFVFYAIYLFTIVRIGKMKMHDLAQEAKTSILPILIWGVLGVAVTVFYNSIMSGLR